AQLRAVGRRTARGAVAGARGQGAGAAARAACSHPRRRGRAGGAGDAPPPAAVVRRRGRTGACRRRGRRAAARGAAAGHRGRLSRGAAVAWDPIPPEVCARLRGLRIGSRRAAGGRGFGLHRSRSRGAGMEFVQYRGYEPGDELRRIDWKLYARSDRFFVREAERESPLNIWVLVDTSGSMAQADEQRPEWSRLDAARALAACVFEVALAQGDPFGLALAGKDRKSTRLNSSHVKISYAVFCLKKNTTYDDRET